MIKKDVLHKRDNAERMNRYMALIGFIGVGNMGYPMLSSATKVFSKEEIIFTTKTEQRMKGVKQQLGVEYVLDKKELVQACKYIVLAVKPQFYDEVLEEIKEVVNENHIIITVAPGFTTDNVKYILGEGVKVVRSMPNTPALVGEGMSGICFSQNKFEDDELEVIGKFFNSFGKYEVFDERLMDAVVCASGSSPAYVYMFIEALADSAVRCGIPRAQAYKLVAQTVLGSAKMVLETKEHPGVLKDKVCSPAGTTIEGVAALEEYGFRNAIMKATERCYDKAVSFKK